jgi:hypothetical protein
MAAKSMALQAQRVVVGCLCEAIYGPVMVRQSRYHDVDGYTDENNAIQLAIYHRCHKVKKSTNEFSTCSEGCTNPMPDSQETTSQYREEYAGRVLRASQLTARA